MKPCLRYTAMIVLVLSAAWAQGLENRTVVVHGEIAAFSPTAGGMNVEMSANGAAMSEVVPVEADGSFQFRNVTPGMHQLRVTSMDGQVLHQEFVSISGSSGPLSIRLDDTRSANRAASGTVSLQQLTHKIPAAAQKAYDKGEQCFSKGDLEQSHTYLLQAVTIDPEFVDAYNELGATDAGMKHLPEAAEHFQKAIDLAPENPRALVNLSIVLAQMRRLHEAGEVSRRALKVVPNSGVVHYILAVSLLSERGNVDEMITEFERSVGQVPAAHLTVAEVLVQCGRPQEAIRHLEEYIQGDAKRDAAEARLLELKQLMPASTTPKQ
jgi:Tfp pilus assembly protein PilF